MDQQRPLWFSQHVMEKYFLVLHNRTQWFYGMIPWVDLFVLSFKVWLYFIYLWLILFVHLATHIKLLPRSTRWLQRFPKENTKQYYGRYKQQCIAKSNRTICTMFQCGMDHRLYCSSLIYQEDFLPTIGMWSYRGHHKKKCHKLLWCNLKSSQYLS